MEYILYINNKGQSSPVEKVHGLTGLSTVLNNDEQKRPWFNIRTFFQILQDPLSLPEL